MGIDVQIIFVFIYFLAIMIEVIWSLVKDKKVYNFKDSIANLGIVLVGKILKPLSLLWAYFLFGLIEPFQVFQIEVNIWTVLVAFFLVELIYYWYHRISHEKPLLWTIHATHHSSEHFNLTTAGRLNWLGKFLSPILYLPLIWFGFSSKLILACLAVSLIYQIYVHTQMIGKIRIIEGILNTPSAHRVHHARNEKYIDKNYGGMLLIYDRLFGTYQKEQEMADYGITTGFAGYNPFRLNFNMLINYFKRHKSKIKYKK